MAEHLYEIPTSTIIEKVYVKPSEIHASCRYGFAIISIA